jgi:ABC-2 type transport system permease protein
MSEEKKLKTDQLLLTAPVSLGGQVFAKFIAAFLMYILALSITLVYALVLTAYTTPGWAMVIGNYVGLLLVGGAIISIGLFISTLTESQIVAAIGTYGVVIVVLLIDALGSIFTSALAQKIVYSISFYNRYIEFTQGLFNLEHVIFFISFFAVFIFLTVRLLEKRRWN